MAPAVLALNGASITVSALLITAGVFAVQVLRHWDIESGSARQLELERRTYLISMLVTFCLGASVLSLLLFVYNAEQLSSQIVGAMCATGVLNADVWGWPTLALKILVFFAGAAWLMLNRLDNRSPEYPLVRVKYALLLGIVPLVLAETAVQLAFFLALDPDVITSCCGALFTSDGEGVAATISGLAPGWSLAAMVAAGIALFLLGLRQLARPEGGGVLYGLAAIAVFGAGLVGIVSFVALYIYEHPQHHCPFCILKAGHGFVGYWIYLPLFAATALAIGVGLISLWRHVPSLRAPALAEIRRFTAVSLALFGLYHGVVIFAVMRSNLRMTGVWW